VVETRFEEQEDAMFISAAAGLLREPTCINAIYRMVAASHSQNEHDLPEALWSVPG